MVTAEHVETEKLVQNQLCLLLLLLQCISMRGYRVNYIMAGEGETENTDGHIHKTAFNQNQTCPGNKQETHV